MTNVSVDIIDLLIGAGVDRASRLEALRARRPVTRQQAQQSYLALFQPGSADDASLSERFAVAVFVSRLHGDAAAANHYAGLLSTVGRGGALAPVVDQAAAAAAARGPYGHFPLGPLNAEDQAGPIYRVDRGEADILGPRLVAALEHAHLLVFHPRDSNPAALRRLVDAGWSTTGIVTLSQLVSFLAFQLRVVSGLRTLIAA